MIRISVTCSRCTKEFVIEDDKNTLFMRNAVQVAVKKRNDTCDGICHVRTEELR